MKKVIKYIELVVVICGLVGCTPRQFNLEDKDTDYTNIEIIEVSTGNQIILDNEESKILMEQLGKCTFKKKGKNQNTALYTINLLKGVSTVKSFEIVDEYSIIYLDKHYKSDEAFNLEIIHDLMIQEEATKQGINQEDIEEKVFKVDHSNARICIYTSKLADQADEKIEYVTVDSNGEKVHHKDFDAYFDKLTWIEEETKAILSYHSSKGQNFRIIDLATGQWTYKGDLDYQAISEGFELQGEKLKAQPKNVQDFRLTYDDISNDGKKIMMRYSFQDETDQMRSGSFWYELETGQMSGIIQDY